MEGYNNSGEKVFVEKYKIPDNLYDHNNAEYIALNNETYNEEYVFYKTLERALLPKLKHNKKVNGEILEYYPNGRIRVKMEKINNQITFFATYYDNGNIESICEEWRSGLTFGDSYEYYSDGKVRSVCLRPNGNFGGIKRYFPNGKLRSCNMGDYYIEWFENNRIKCFVETDPNNDYFSKCNIMWDEYGEISFAIIGIDDKDYLEFYFEDGKLLNKFIKGRYEFEPKLYFVKNGKKIEHSFLENIYYFTKINSYENYLPKVNIPNIDWNNYVVDSGICCAEI
jgi:antitoxin component YwqK of YwqJK toxin-antitoxin module